MARKERSELAAGLFVVVALGAGVGVLLWLGAADLLARPSQRACFYVSRNEGSRGLKAGSFVQVNDRVVGKIDELRYQPGAGRTLYVAEIEDPDLRIHADGEARAAAGFVGGAALLILDPGSETAPPADEAHPVLIGGGAFSRAMSDLAGAAEVLKAQLDAEQKESLLSQILRIAQILGVQFDPEVEDSLMAAVRTSARDVAAMTGNLRKQTDPEEKTSLMATVKRSASDIEATTGTLRKELDRNRDGSLARKIHATADEAEKTAKAVGPDLRKTVAKVRGYTEKDLAEIITKVRSATGDLVPTVANLRAASSTAKDVLVLNRKQLEDTIVNLKEMSANLNAAAKEIRRNPWRLLHRPGEKTTRSENIYDAARAFGEGAGELNDAIARLQALAKAKPAVAADDPVLKDVTRRLQTSFEKFRKVEDNLWKELAQ